ncbi:MAG: sigma-54-dependent Fis family transcriptional regulator [Planctomycetes bacterium]|nr:sigma-54-dependent Fis family transcriptional regulator [Planctomycetota bacterium]MBL7043466.1 sigma-54-dependent Fis family transcriptional regulator [Pirellulaceae bacterium]
MANLLVVDDETSVHQLFQSVFGRLSWEVVTAVSGAEALDAVRSSRPDVAMLDIVLPDASGLDIFRQIQQLDPKLPVIIITGHGRSETAIQAMQLGALDYLTKPLNVGELRKVVKRGIEIRRLMNEPVEIDAEASDGEVRGDALVGRCAAMQEVYKAIGRVASQDVSVLIRGESGTGKELVARALYHHSDRRDGPFLPVNCAAIPEPLLESELFGHEKGAFTGADKRRIGKFEQCNGGTLFLDEIGDMAPTLQSKVLRVLQEQCFERVGGNQTIKTDARVIAATNRDLESMLADNQFRQDLYYRLNGYTIELPPLRKRGADLELLVERFRVEANRELDKRVQRVSPQAIRILRSYDWPGNARELRSVVRQGILQTTGPVLLADFLPELENGEGQSGMEAGGASPWQALDALVDEGLNKGTDSLYQQATDQIDRWLIARVLNHTNGHLTETARILGITRSTLRAKMQNLGISVERSAHTDS